MAITLLMNRLLGPEAAAVGDEARAVRVRRDAGRHAQRARPVPIKYYAVAIAFMLFDLETVFLFIWALGAQPLTGFMLLTFFLFAFLLVADPALRLQGAAARSGDRVAMDGSVHDPPIARRRARREARRAFEYLSTKKDELVGWARKFSLFPYPFVTACCAMEFMAVSSSPYDTDRFGAALPRFSPRQSDLLMVVGTVTHKQAPVLLKVYEQMCEPKWVMAFGVCATSGGFYQNYATMLTSRRWPSRPGGFRPPSRRGR